HAGTVLEDMKTWMEEHEYESVQQMRGSMSHQHSADPTAFERANYIRALETYT
ncbi:MAG: dihydroorotate dehydrogenase-like protein, partial [Verrucomicrobiota bacterium]|nr:dihydroorotate dehydrogenase-like protein [Verrucomicrobiota bacterium]